MKIVSADFFIDLPRAAETTLHSNAAILQQQINRLTDTITCNYCPVEKPNYPLSTFSINSIDFLRTRKL